MEGYLEDRGDIGAGGRGRESELGSPRAVRLRLPGEGEGTGTAIRRSMAGYRGEQ